ncbi:DUF3892 domain-containing protein [Agrobacterium tumefaciens]|uniref:DUF3892 domain-containing protein n=1 Tax=Agrobacterium tumefaciens TaxID=358 RepID=UPI0015721379|nr:DUF3892 domain-containing protein [Agrobacterium tumefaciens]NTA82602.1 DUF3892 domain-containing protein [Agrobacterium tumefaciens]
MAGRFRIRCIKKQPRNDIYNRITHVGGVGQTQWTLTTDEVISRIEKRTEAFYVEQPTGDQVDVIVSVSRFGNKYLKTTADGDEPNNLLNLPECP